MLSVLEIEENLFLRNTYTRYHVCLMRVFILLLSTRYPVQHDKCASVIIQYNITTSPLLLSTSHNVYSKISLHYCYCCVLGILLYHSCVCVVVLWSNSLYLGWIVSVNAGCARNPRKLIFRRRFDAKYLHQVSYVLDACKKPTSIVEKAVWCEIFIV